MPFNFVNTLGSSAGYYVGKNLGLTGESTFVSRRGSAFAAALACAVADLSSGVASQALVGAIEECLLPPRRFSQLLALPGGRVTAEGSHWLLLAPSEDSGAAVPRETIETGEFDGYEARGAAELASFILRNPAQRMGSRSRTAPMRGSLRYRSGRFAGTAQSHERPAVSR